MFSKGESGELKSYGLKLLSQAVRNLLAAFALGLSIVILQYVLGGLGG
jgi:hypothetical protein